MVGVRKSNRCDNCRIRKKKCDEKRPSCTECVKSGWTCPGYKSTTPWKFVDEVPRLAEQYAGRKYVYDAPVSKYDFDEDLQFQGLLVLHHTAPSIPRLLEINPLASAFVHCLDGKVKSPLFSLRTSGSCFDFIPARLGYNLALDDAVSCIATIFRGGPLVSYGADREIYRKYVKALASLRGFLSDTSSRMEAETLCASILLQTCELVVSSGRGDWGNLSRGTSVLLSSRGVRRYSSAFEMSMLESQLPYIFGNSLKLKEHCFISSPEWQKLLLQGPTWEYQKTQSTSLSLRTRLIAILSDMPSLVIYHSDLKPDEMYRGSQKRRTDLLIQKATTMLNDVKRCITLEAEPLFLTYGPSSQGLQPHINYPDLLSAVGDCVANTTLITLDRILRSLCNAKAVSTILTGETFGENEQFDSPDVVAGWRRRAVDAFKWVKGQSFIAAKPLDFGIRQIQTFGDGESDCISLEQIF